MRISCPRCGATLGEYSSETIVVRHRQRLIIMTVEGVQALQCWRCGAVFDGDRVRAMVGHREVRHAPAEPRG
jgi:uncharacterized C2H2 Zn-finger protein